MKQCDLHHRIFPFHHQRLINLGYQGLADMEEMARLKTRKTGWKSLWKAIRPWSSLYIAEWSLLSHSGKRWRCSILERANERISAWGNEGGVKLKQGEHVRLSNTVWNAQYPDLPSCHLTFRMLGTWCIFSRHENERKLLVQGICCGWAENPESNGK